MPVYIAGASHSKSSPPLGPLRSESYIVYEIKSKDDKTTAHRRYTEFEALQSHLFRTYPRSVIPPIPNKENISGTSLWLIDLPNIQCQIIFQSILEAIQKQWLNG